MNHLFALKPIVLASLLSSVTIGQSQSPTPQWSITQPANSEISTVLGANADGSFIVRGSTHLIHIYTGKHYLTKHDATGAQIWQREFQGQFIHGGFVDEEGNTYATGNSYATPSIRRSWLGKFAPDGTTLWTSSVTHNAYTSNGDLVRDADGYFYSTGTTFEDLGGSEYSDRQIGLRKWSPTGESVWFKEYGTGGDENGGGLAIDGNGNFYLLGAGESESSDGESTLYSSLLLKKLDSNGNLLWENSITSAGLDREILSSGFVVDDAGNIFIGGYTDGVVGESALGDYDSFLGRWDTDGNAIWIKQFGSDRHDRLTSLELGKNQTLLIAGYDNALNSISSATTYLSQLNYDGTENWSFERTLFNTRKDISGLTPNYMGDLIATSQGGSFMSQGFIELFAFPKSADFDGDGDIDGRDFLAWQRGFGKLNATLADGDANGDSLVNAEDLAIWQDQYQHGQSLAANVAVPEPNAIVLVAIASTVQMWRRRPAIR